MPRTTSSHYKTITCVAFNVSSFPNNGHSIRLNHSIQHHEFHRNRPTTAQTSSGERASRLTCHTNKARACVNKFELHATNRVKNIAYKCCWMLATANWKAGWPPGNLGGGICKHNLLEVGACYTNQAVNHSAPCMKLFVHIHTSPLKMYETPPHKFPWLGSQYTRHWIFFQELKSENTIAFMQQGSVLKWH